jgi:hypothetical protein
LVLTFFHPVKLRHAILGVSSPECGQYHWD